MIYLGGNKLKPGLLQDIETKNGGFGNVSLKNPSWLPRNVKHVLEEKEPERKPPKSLVQ